MTKPKLVWFREPCPACGAETGREAEEKCAPPGGHCPASGITDNAGFIIQATDESLKACTEWDEIHG